MVQGGFGCPLTFKTSNGIVFWIGLGFFGKEVVNVLGEILRGIQWDSVSPPGGTRGLWWYPSEDTSKP